ncbi:outer membrane beta-barrel protein (plasmid) [Bernardetia sp. Wsw4-3y2]|uniref:outer membrane beta-barrel protein n=1 Tax=Bernardetia sp. Wsw4-3y2 TaxID=3127471 RepID=UPI0030CFFE9F
MKHIYDNQNGNHKSSEERFTERFKEVAQSYEPTFQPADWSAMQSKLAAHNEKDRKAVVFRRLAVFATMGAAAVILLFGGYQFLDNSANKISNGGIAFQENSIKNQTSTNQKSINNNSTDDKTLTQSNLEENNNHNKDIASNLSGSSNTDSAKNKKTTNFTKTKLYSNSKTKLEKNNQIAFNHSLDNSEEKIVITNTLLTDNEASKEVESNQVLSALKLEKATFDLFADVKPNEVVLPVLEIDEMLIASNQNEELIRKNPVASAIGKWRIGAALMAMTNIYKSNDKQRMNYANGYGVMADYQVAKRFNISAGALYMKKQIDIEESLSIPNITNYFNPNDNAWVKKNKTKINWQLIDLPIHLRYNAIETTRNKWFVSAGTSNYFFLKERYESDYTVSYQDIYDPRLTRSQEIVRQRETQSALQLFATINVSAGIETSLGKHLTLQVEPYWRFPVRSLGSEGVFVQTGGLLTRINFAL